MSFSFKKQMGLLPLAALGFCLVSFGVQAMDDENESPKAHALAILSKIQQFNDLTTQQGNKLKSLLDELKGISSVRHYAGFFGTISRHIAELTELTTSYSKGLELWALPLMLSDLRDTQATITTKLPDDDQRKSLLLGIGAEIDSLLPRFNQAIGIGAFLAPPIEKVQEKMIKIDELECMIKEYKLAEGLESKAKLTESNQ